MLAWGVEGYVVSFIAPHSLTARALVVAPGDELTINNALARGTGRGPRRRPPDARAPAGRGHPRRASALTHGTLAQIPGASFYHRLRERFGRLAR